MHGKILGINSKVMLMVSALLLAAACASSAYSQGRKLDLSNAVIVHSSAQPRHAKAAELLQYEIQRRTDLD